MNAMRASPDAGPFVGDAGDHCEVCGEVTKSGIPVGDKAVPVCNDCFQAGKTDASIREKVFAAAGTDELSASTDLGPFINMAPHPPCECGEEIHLAYLHPGRPGFAEVLCFRGHFLGWVPWPDCRGQEGPRRYDS